MGLRNSSVITDTQILNNIEKIFTLTNQGSNMISLKWRQSENRYATHLTMEVIRPLHNQSIFVYSYNLGVFKASIVNTHYLGMRAPLSI